MLRRSLAVALLLVPAAVGDVTVSFDDSFQFTGSHEASNVTALLLVWPPASAATFTLQVPHGGTWERTTAVRTDASEDTSDVHVQRHDPVGSESGNLEPLASASLTGRGWGSILVIADAISIQAGGDGRGTLVGATTSLEDLRTMHPYPEGTSLADPRAPVPGEVHLGLSTDGATMLDVSGLRSLTWHNATLQCGDECQLDASYRRESHLVVTASLQSHVYEYITLNTDRGAMAGMAEPHAISAGGPSVVLETNGTVRLPLAFCEDCSLDGAPITDNGTLRLIGHTRLSDFSTTDGDLRSRVEGDWEEVWLDEKRVGASPSTIAAPAAAFSMLALLAWLTRWVAIRLGVHKRGEPNRQAIIDAIAAQPGIRSRALMRATGIGNGTLDHHAHAMTKRGEIVVRTDGGKKHFFLPEQLTQRPWRQWAAWQDEAPRRIAGLLRDEHQIPQREVIERAAAIGMSRGAVQRGLMRLIWADIVSCQKQGRVKRYSLIHPGIVDGHEGYGSQRSEAERPSLSSEVPATALVTAALGPQTTWGFDASPRSPDAASQRSE